MLQDFLSCLRSHSIFVFEFQSIKGIEKLLKKRFHQSSWKIASMYMHSASPMELVGAEQWQGTQSLIQSSWHSIISLRSTLYYIA